MVTLAAKGRKSGSSKIRKKAGKARAYRGIFLKNKSRGARKVVRGRAGKGKLKGSWYDRNGDRARAAGRAYVRKNKARIAAKRKVWLRKTQGGKNPLYAQGKKGGRHPRRVRHVRTVFGRGRKTTRAQHVTRGRKPAVTKTARAAVRKAQQKASAKAAKKSGGGKVAKKFRRPTG